MLFARLTNKVSDGLEGLLLAHDEADALGFAVAHELAVADAALLPLLAEAVKLNSHLKDALETLSSGFSFDLGKVDLKD